MGKLRSKLCLLTDLPADDWGPHDQTYELVQHVVREGNEKLGACEAQGRQAGPQLLLHGALAQHAVFEPEWEGALLQDMHQGEELVQVWILDGGSGMSREGPGPWSRKPRSRKPQGIELGAEWAETLRP